MTRLSPTKRSANCFGFEERRGFLSSQIRFVLLLALLSVAPVTVRLSSASCSSIAADSSSFQEIVASPASAQLAMNSTTGREVSIQQGSIWTEVATVITAFATAISALILAMQYWRARNKLQIQVLDFCIEQTDPDSKKILWGTFLAENRGGEGTRINKLGLDAKYGGGTMQRQIPILSAVAGQSPNKPGVYVPPHESVTFYYPWKLESNQLLSKAECRITFWHTHGRITKSLTAKPGRHQINPPPPES